MNVGLSIIIPVYNIQEYLSKCLGSVLAQTYSPIEIICVDDGSTDGSGVLLDEYATKDNRIRVFHKENGGVSSARLKGVEEARGDWIGFVDGDDWVEPEMYERLIENAIKYDADISHCGYQMVFPNKVDYYYNTGQIIEQESRDAVIELLSGVYEPGLCNKLYRKDLFSKILREEIIDLSIKNFEDLLMNYYLFCAATKIVFDDFCPYHYQVRAGSAAKSKLSLKKVTDIEKVYTLLMNETADDLLINSLCRQLLIRHWIRIGTMSQKSNNLEIQGYIHYALYHLRSELKKIKSDKFCPKVLKYQTIMAAFFPRMYCFIHYIYGELSGVNHKYDI